MARKPITDMSAWPSLTLEGNLIAPAMVASVDRRQAPEQTEGHYRVRKGLTIREEISTAFRVGQSHYDAFAKLQSPSVEATRRFVRGFLAETFGFDDLASADGMISFLAGGRVPIVVVPPSDEKLDRRSPTLSAERSRSPALALQDYLNDSDQALWGLVTNGFVIRLMRDNASLTRPAYVEADLAQIFANEDAASFAVLWSLIHRTRFGAAGAPVTDCALERWREAGSREGEAARDRLASQVELALKVLGSGFLEANPDLAARLRSGEVNLTEWFNELLRLVYRLIFLMVAEDRNLLHPETAKPEARKLYVEGYSLAALRAQCVRAASWDKHHDRYEGIKIIFRALAHGQPALGLPALGGLFAADMLPHLETTRLRNRAFMAALYRLAWLNEKTGMVPVNWRAMETEELGSVYESLLELQPQLGDDGKTLRFASETAEQKGNQRKTTGSYYTPDSLVQALLDTALDPVLEKTEAEAVDPVASLLKLTVIDPACGSGHFLLAAARRIATRVARIRAEGTPSLADFRHALRDVARSCIHGVDRNPMAVELTKVALWIETVDPGLPLGFFDAQIRCGDSLLGVFDLKVLEQGIPDAAMKPLSGDDKEVVKYYSAKDRREKAERDRIATGFGLNRARDLMRDFAALRAMPENTLEEIEAKVARLRSLTGKGAAAWQLETACDLYVAAFLLPKVKGGPHAGPDGMPRRGAETVPTSGVLWEWLRGVSPFGPMFGAAVDASRTTRAFHWPLEFPDVMAQGGFDVVIGNPPWDIVQQEENVSISLDDRLKSFFKHAPYDVLSGRRDLYKLFLCRLPDMLRDGGLAGLLVPVGYLVEEDCRGLRARLWQSGSIEKIAHFQNAKHCFFSRVHASYRFSIIEYRKSYSRRHWFSYTITDLSFALTEDMGITLAGDAFHDYLEAGAFGELHKDLQSLKAHRRIMASNAFDSKLRFGLTAEWHATTHKPFSVSADRDDALPVGKNRDIHQFNDAFSEASFFVSSADAKLRAAEKEVTLDENGARILVRDIARNDDTVTLICCLSERKLSSYDTPAVKVVGMKDIPISSHISRFIVGYLNSRLADFLIRPFVDKHIKGYVLQRIPVPALCVSSDGVLLVSSVVDELIEIGQFMGRKVIWENERGRRLLRNLDRAIENIVGVSPADREIVHRDFSHLYEQLDGLGAVKAGQAHVLIDETPLLADHLSDGVWARAIQQPNDAGAALTAILKAIDGPTPSRTVRLAAAMMLEPHLLTSLLPQARAQEWRRLVGQEAEPRTGNVVGFAARTNQGWGVAVSNHRGNGRLIEDLSAGTWAQGPGLDAFDTAGWPDGRAGFLLEALRQLDLDQTVTSMPDEVRGWITHASAA
jgi:hypothetical protein